MDRFNQMSGQADLIAKKKIEIEAKLKLQKEAAQNSGSISVYNQLAGTSKNIPAAESSSSNQRRKKALPIGNLKNRWGFKGIRNFGCQGGWSVWGSLGCNGRSRRIRILGAVIQHYSL